MVSPFASDDFSVEWNGQYAVSATLEYAPSRSATFGLFVAHSSFGHTGQTPSGGADCMIGTTRTQTGGGITSRIYAARWRGMSLTLGASVGATQVGRDRPLFDNRGQVYGKVTMSPSVDLVLGASFGLEATIAPGVRLAVDGGYEAIENQISLAHSLVARTSLRFGL